MADDVGAPLSCEQTLAFGPVPSRRLGISLGVNVVPRKICSYNCVYCQLGRTTNLTIERGVYTPTDAIVDAAIERLDHAPSTEYVTFIGDGEPTLALNLKEVIGGISERWSGRFALLTNGSLLCKSDVRDAASMCDVVLPTMAAGDEDTFRRLHRPHRDISFEKYAQGLRDLVRGYSGATWAEVMLVRGLNDHAESLRRIGELVDDIEPAEIHLTAPIRPPSVSTVNPPTSETVELALRLIPGSVDFTYPEEADMPSSYSDPVRQLTDIAGTHPLRRDQAVGVLVGAGRTEAEAAATIDALVESQVLVALARNEDIFYVRGRPGTGAMQHV
jgi:wyosine [tRNA(Phe)-imidazoG37] synthetase (radical SAM superfamily)